MTYQYDSEGRLANSLGPRRAIARTPRFGQAIKILTKGGLATTMSSEKETIARNDFCFYGRVLPPARPRRRSFNRKKRDSKDFASQAIDFPRFARRKVGNPKKSRRFEDCAAIEKSIYINALYEQVEDFYHSPFLPESRHGGEF
jgi:hypothetical protein